MSCLMNFKRNGFKSGLWLTTVLLVIGLNPARAHEPDQHPAPLLSWGAMPKDIPDGYMVIEGDIVVPSGFDPRTMPWSTDFWPGGSVVYEFDDNVTPANRVKMRDAMREWEAVAQVSFHEEGSCGIIHCVHIQDSDHNDSEVGRQFFRQTINIHDWGWRFIMCHELAHTLGFYHEQSRTDRDTYVRINWDQIQPGEENNFYREDGSGRYGPYDFDSVMHYGQFDFAIGDQPTITVLPPNEEWQTRIGQRTHLSQMDQMIMSFIYSYSNWRFVDRNYPGPFQHGTFLEPYRDFVTGVSNTPNGGVLWVQPGTYPAHGTYSRPMTWHAPIGGVSLN